MKHIFIINPAAGPSDATSVIRKKLSKLPADIDYEIYTTSGPGDATRFVKSLCQEGSDTYRFYACGGDGTLNEVVSGVVGFNNASIGVYPCGSGNDFVKYYGTANDFSNISDLVFGDVHNIDVMKVDDRYSINMVNFGFDTAVVKTMEKVKRFKLFVGKRAYYVGIVTALINSMKTKCSVFVDGKRIGKDSILLCTVGNGKYIGGSFKCAPRSSNDDGLLEVCLINPISRFKFISLIKSYTIGTHLENPRLKNDIDYCRGRTIEVEHEDGVYYCVDGEITFASKFKVEVLDKAISFIIPKKISEKMGISSREAVVC